MPTIPFLGWITNAAAGLTGYYGHVDRPPAGRSRMRKPATENQLRAIRSIANRQHADLGGLLREFGVDRPEDLSLKQASELIDTLKTAGGI
jgi:hypothetical protein